MNKLRNTAIATGIFVAGAFGVLEVDNSITHTISQEKIECFQKAPLHAEACSNGIEKNNGSQEFVVEALEVGLLLGAAASGVEFIRTLRQG